MADKSNTTPVPPWAPCKRPLGCDYPDCECHSQTTECPVSLTDIVSAAIAAHKRTSATLAEPGATQAAAEAIRSLVERYASGR